MSDKTRDYVEVKGAYLQVPEGYRVRTQGRVSRGDKVVAIYGISFGWEEVKVGNYGMPVDLMHAVVMPEVEFAPTMIYTGILSLGDHGDTEKVLRLSTLDEPLAEELKYHIADETVSIRYWISRESCTEKQAEARFLQGDAECQFMLQYHLDRYLWTDEDLMIGDHDLLAELKQNVGKYLRLEIQIH